MRVSGCNRVDFAGRVLNQAIQVTFDFKVPSETTSNPCEYRVEIIFASEPKFREFESDDGAIISAAWKQTKDCAVQTEYGIALIHYP